MTKECLMSNDETSGRPVPLGECRLLPSSLGIRHSDKEVRAMADVVLSILAHPDDAEFLCAGTLIRLVREHGWQAHIATMTPGDCGSAELPPEEISRIRRGEGAKAAALIGATYHCLEERDLQIFYNERALERVTCLLRSVRPRVVLTHSPA